MSLRPSILFGMRENVTIIYPPVGLPFNWMRQRPQQICIELAKLGYKVVYCEKLPSFQHREILLPKGEYIRKSNISDNLFIWLVSNV